MRIMGFVVWSFVLIGLLAVSPELFAQNEMQSKEVKAATVEVKQGTAEIKSVTEEVKVTLEKALPSLPAKPQPGAPASTGVLQNNDLGNVEIQNYGIQAVFINSNVTINGGSIQAEMTQPAQVEPAPEVKRPERPSMPPPSGEPPKEKEKPGKFDEIIKDATKQTGLFSVYTKEDKEKVFWEILPSQLDKEFLITGSLATGVGAGWMKPGTYLGYIIVVFKKIDEKIHLIQKNLWFTVPEGSPEKRSVEKNYSDSLVAAFPVEATNPANCGLVLELGKYFLTDFFEIGKNISSDLGGGYGFDRGSSYIQETKVFPENVVTRCTFAYRSGMASGNIALPDSRSLQVDILIDVRPLNENPDFKARPADPRVGHFIEAHIDFGDVNRSTQFVRYITRWDIRKASPELEMSPPVKPVVFWIENTVPEVYREPIRNGILEWNKAFAAIGIKDPLVVNYQPQDATWDISDARYNTIHWNNSHDQAYGAVAQWISNPKTGEILNGGFLVEAENIRSLLNVRRYHEPDRVAQLKDQFSKKLPENPRRLVCEYGQGLTDQAVFGLTLLAAKVGIENVSQEFLDEYVKEFLFWLAAHEFGHVLGFRHNFKGSTLLPVSQLHDKDITSEKGNSSSVMDYVPVNFAPPGVEQGDYFGTTIGPCDYLTVEYAYKTIRPATGQTEADVLNAIAQKGETHDYVYGPDEDLYGGSPYYGPGIDPTCNQNDLGDDPLGYAKQLTDTVMEAIPNLPKLVKEGENYSLVRSGFGRMLGYYFNSSRFALKYIGGQYVNRVKKSKTTGPMPLEPVSPAKQQEALNFFVDTIFSDKIFAVEPDFMNLLASEKWLHWGSSFPGPASEYSLTTVVNSLYDLILYQLYSPVILRRILDAEKQRRPEAASFTVPQLFRTLNEGIWSEVYSAANSPADSNAVPKKPLISTYRRILQRDHLKLMITILLEPPMDMPEDARTQAWRTLSDLEKRLAEVTQKTEKCPDIDDYSRDHLAESLAKIHRALEARTIAPVDY